MKSFTSSLRPLLAASALALGCLGAQATTVNFTGMTDSGPLSGSAFSGSFTYAEPVSGFDGAVDLDSFLLDFDGHTFTLADADLPALAWFAAGSFLGVDYTDTDSFSTAVTLVAGFFDLSEAFFSYQPVGADQGLGSITAFTTQVVPEPGSIALLLAGLGAIGATRRRQAAA